MRSGRFARLLALAVAALALTSTVPAAAAPEPRFPVAVKIDAALGCDSAPSGWVPVLVHMAYVDPGAWPEGPAARDSVERLVVRLKARRWNGTFSSVDQREESLSPGGAKRFYLYAYTDSAVNLVVTVTRERDGAAAAIETFPKNFHISEPSYYSSRYYNQAPNAGKQELRIALVSGSRQNLLGVIKSIDLPNRINPLLASAEEPAMVPDRRIGWAPFDLVFLHDYPIASLTPAQQEALRSWVLGGGRLVVSAGLDAGWLAQPFFRDLLPPGTAVVHERADWEGREGVAYAHVSLEGAPPPLSAPSSTAFAEGRIPTLEELLPPGIPVDLLPQVMVQEIESQCQMAEYLLEGESEGAKEQVEEARHRLLELSAKLLQAAAAFVPTGTAIRVPAALAPPAEVQSRTATAFALAVPRWAAGKGEVTLLPFDLAGGPLAGASDETRAAFWRSFFERYRPRTGRSADPGAWPVATALEQEQTMLATLLPEFDVPVMTISALALVYVVIVGPVNFLVLRRLKREPLVVFTVPAIAVASILATIAAGYIWQGARGRTYEITEVHARAGQRFASSARWLGVLSAGSSIVETPLHQDEDGAAISTQREDAAWRGFTTLEGRPRVLSGIGLSRWEGTLLRYDSVVDLAGDISVEVEEQPPILQSRPEGFVGPLAYEKAPPRIFVRNETARPLERTVVYWRDGGHRYWSGPIAPGARVEVVRGNSPEEEAWKKRLQSGEDLDEAMERAMHRFTLQDRAWTHAIDWTRSRRPPWALAAQVAPEPPRPFAARDGAAASGPWGDLPAPLERAGLIFVAPGEGS